MLALETKVKTVVGRFNRLCRSNRYLTQASATALTRRRGALTNMVERAERLFRAVSTICRGDVRPTRDHFQRWYQRMLDVHAECDAALSVLSAVPVHSAMTRPNAHESLKSLRPPHAALMDVSDRSGNHYSPTRPGLAPTRLSDLLSPSYSPRRRSSTRRRRARAM